MYLAMHYICLFYLQILRLLKRCHFEIFNSLESIKLFVIYSNLQTKTNKEMCKAYASQLLE